MNFVSTRGGEVVSGARAIVQGLSENGGLFVPESFPKISSAELSAMLEMSYPERVTKILMKYLDEYDEKELLSACEAAYVKFEGTDPAPLVKIDKGRFVLELFHGPTCAFTDMALTLLPYLLRKGCDLCGIKEDILMLVATSGDAGKAALEAFKDAKGVSVMVFYPDEGVSKMQKLQMSTQEGNNVNVVAVKGNFDDCQTAVKTIFNNQDYVRQLKEKNILLSSANSINFGTLAPQIAYYFSAYLDMVSGGQIQMGDEIDFYVPAGNFGNILAGYYAKLMGLPIRRLHCASNINNVLTDFFNKGEYNTDRPFFRTMSPSMDVLISSDLERLLFEISGRNAKITADRMVALKANKSYKISATEMKMVNETFHAGFANEDEVVETVYDIFCEYGYTMDTHTGCAQKVANDWKEKNKKDTTPVVVVATANPYKFPQDVLYAVTGNDVKDSFKGIKRLHAATAMAVPKSLLALRDKSARFTRTVSASTEKMFAEVVAFVDKK
jgi:threonine synthase